LIFLLGIATQGRGHDKHWVTSYSVKYSSNGSVFTDYEDGKVFNANTDRFIIVRNNFNPPITARFIRLVVQSWFAHIALRMEIYGCNTTSST